MGSRPTGIDYSDIHRIDSPANRALRATIWAKGDDLGQQSFATPRYFDFIAARLGMGPGMRVLDLGSGSGGPAVYIADRTGCRLTGLEVNEVGVEVSRSVAQKAGLEDRVDFVLADGMDMPFDDATFDAVYSMNVMNVFPDKVALFREVRRVLRPGGVWAFLSGTFEFGPGDEEARRLYEAGYAIPQYTDDLAGYKRKLAEAGFVVDEVTEYISDYRATIARWLDGWRAHRDAIAAEQGADQTDHHIAYFVAYLRMIDEGKASNHLVISHRPEN
ncbi:MAG: methyltransferase domain-containing protein [Thermoleophilia bacterium]|nr:methyltransferase domain-containing protein [Thermoleophilia bacterium]